MPIFKEKVCEANKGQVPLEASSDSVRKGRYIHTHTHIYIYVYIYRESVPEFGKVIVVVYSSRSSKNKTK